jgi:sugar transferase (PEP-CTERM system associated)
MVVELIILYGSAYLGIEIRFYGQEELKTSVQPIAEKAIVFSIIMMFSMTAVGLHSRSHISSFTETGIRIFFSFVICFIGMALAFYVHPPLYVGRGAFGLSMILAFAGIVATRVGYQKIDDHHIFRRKVLVLGAGKKARIVENEEEYFSRLGVEIVGYVSIDKNEPQVSADKVISIKTGLFDLAEDDDVDEIILAMDDRRQGFPINGLLECKMKGVVIRDLVDFLERLRGHIELEALHPSVMILSDGFTNAVTPRPEKRIFDVLVSLIILLVGSPVIILTACIIWLSSMGRDPIFYRQTRIGLWGIPFQVLKFRSMKTDAEKDGAQFAKKKDSRVTFVGAFIRKTRIDELPQIINVLKGEMSFVGPRPERPEFVLGYEQSIPHYNLRHTVKPGITGWAQICYPYGETDEDTRNKLQYDLYYIKNYSLFLDLTIILQTVQVVLFGQGAR